MPRVVDVEHLGGRRLRVSFSDGLVRELDFESGLAGVLSTLDDDAVFATVSVDPTAGTVCWPGGIDMDPDVLHGDHEPASGLPAKLLKEYRMQSTT